MPDYKPNQIIRAFAVIALIAALILVVVIVATSGGGSGGGDNKSSAQHAKLSKAGRRAVHRGVWIVHSGDTLGSISLKTGIDVTTLQTLNPDIDPQTLLQGQRIALR